MVMSLTKLVMSPTKSVKSPTKSAKSSTSSLMSPTKEIELRIESSAIFENEYSLDAYIANVEFETTFNNLRKL